MKIAWFTPFSQQSAIGMVGRDICEKLSEREEVDIWTHDSKELIDTDVNVISFNVSDDLSRLRDYDHIIYNIGNFAGNHRDIYDVSQRYKGIVILHDQTLSGFWCQYHTFPEFGGDGVKGKEDYIRLFEKFYGREAAEYARQAYESGHYPVYEYEDMYKFRFIEAAVQNAKGVFTHASFFCNEIRKIYNGPVGYSYLPCKPAKAAECSHEIFNVIKKARKQGKKIVVSNGIVHPVKQIDKVTDMLCAHPETAGKVIYIVVGSYGGDYGEKLLSLSENELKDCFYLLGYQPYDVMNRLIESADMCVNLRYPNSEVCSLSLLEQMSYGKAVLVIKSGVYGEMPNDTVIKVSYEGLSDETAEVFKRLVSGNRDFTGIGERAGKFIKKMCTADAYCDRLLEFLGDVDINMSVGSFQDRVICDIAGKMNALGISEKTAPATFYSTVNSVSGMFRNSDDGCRTVKTIGVWAGFAYHIPGLHREGISRFMKGMTEEISHKYGLNIEVWCYSFNEDEMKTIFSGVSPERLKIITEKNWKNIFSPRCDIVQAVGDVNENKDNLNTAAYYVSEANIMLPLIIYLDSVIGTGKRIFVPAHDMTVADHYEEFIRKDSLYKSRNADITLRADNLARNGAFFFCNSNAVRKKQVLKYVRGLKEENSDFVYLPVIIPENIDNDILPEKQLREKFGITGRYFFYPTQIRPYKNVSFLMKVFAKLKRKQKDIMLVLTGNINDVPELENIVNDNHLQASVKCVGSVSENELYGLYKYAAAIPVPTLFEGDFPFQASEALFMKTPVVVSDIDVVRERIGALGFTSDNCGLPLFDPCNEKQLCDKLSEALRDRKAAVSRQTRFAKKLLAYSWADAADRYYELFTSK